MGLLDPATSDGRVIFFLPWEGMVAMEIVLCSDHLTSCMYVQVLQLLGQQMLRLR